MIRIDAEEVPRREVAPGASDLALQRGAAPLPEADVDAGGRLEGQVRGDGGVGIEEAERGVGLDVAGFGSAPPARQATIERAETNVAASPSPTLP